MDIGLHHPPANHLRHAIHATLAYADLFNYPLAQDEIVRYLAVPAEVAAVRQLLEDEVRSSGLVGIGGMFALKGREEILAVRERREAIARRKWRMARRYVHWLALLPFARMVAVTGSLAVNNVEAPDDIDVLVVTEPGRLWLCRALAIAVVRITRLLGEELCPNYFLSLHELVLTEQDFFGARETAQMVPLYGPEVYDQMRQLNPWVRDYLPQAGSRPNPRHHMGTNGDPWVRLGRVGQALKGLGERLLGGRIGQRLERWEMDRKVRKFNQAATAAHVEDSVSFTADCCKGHFDHHENWILRAFQERLIHYGLDPGVLDGPNKSKEGRP